MASQTRRPTRFMSGGRQIPGCVCIRHGTDFSNVQVGVPVESRVFAYQASFRNRRPFDSASPRPAGVVQWQNTSLPSWPRGFDSPHPLQPRPQRRQLVVTRTGHHPQERECRFFFSCRCRKRGPGGAWGNLCPQKAVSTQPPQSTADGPERREVLLGGLPLRGGRT